MEKGKSARLSWASVVLIVLAVCGLSYLAARLFSGGSGGVMSSYQVLNLPSNRGVQVISDGFVYYDGGSLEMITSSGSTRWSYMIGAGCDFCATDAGVAAWNDKTLTLIDARKGATTFSGTMDGKILSAKVGSKYSAVLVQTDNDSTMILLDEMGRKLTPYIEMNQQSVVDYGFFSGDSLFWVLSLDANGTAPTTTISTYRPGRSHMGNISNTDQVLYHVLFQSSHIVCVGETFVKTYDYMGAEDTSARKLVYGWYLADADDTSDNPLMAFAANAQYDGGSSVQDVRLLRSGVDRVVRFPFGCVAFAVKGDVVYGFSTDGYVMEARVSGERVEAYALPMRIDTVYGVLADGTAVLGYGSEVYMIRLP